MVMPPPTISERQAVALLPQDLSSMRSFLPVTPERRKGHRKKHHGDRTTTREPRVHSGPAKARSSMRCVSEETISNVNISLSKRSRSGPVTPEKLSTGSTRDPFSPVENALSSLETLGRLRKGVKQSQLGSGPRGPQTSPLRHVSAPIHLEARESVHAPLAPLPSANPFQDFIVQTDELFAMARQFGLDVDLCTDPQAGGRLVSEPSPSVLSRGQVPRSTSRFVTTRKASSVFHRDPCIKAFLASFPCRGRSQPKQYWEDLWDHSLNKFLADQDRKSAKEIGRRLSRVMEFSDLYGKLQMQQSFHLIIHQAPPLTPSQDCSVPMSSGSNSGGRVPHGRVERRHNRTRNEVSPDWRYALMRKMWSRLKNPTPP